MFKAQVVILAGGQGSRLRPYTTILPKPLLPLGDVPILEILIRQLKHNGFKDILISTGYLAGLIEAYCGNGQKWNVNIRYVCEREPLGTAGALQLIKQVHDNFLVINGDVFTDMDFSAFLKWHIHQKAMATIAVKNRAIKSDFGVIEVGANKEFQDYHEKPLQHSLVSLGINAFNVKAKGFIKKGEALGMPDLMLRLKSRAQKVCCYQMHDMWLDLGRFEDLQNAQDIFMRHRKKLMRS